MNSGSDPSIAFVSTFPPTVCGLASYTASLVDVLATDDRFSRLGVVSLSDGPGGIDDPYVTYHHRTGGRRSLQAAIEALNTYDMVSIQHEFGIFGGPDGSEVIELMLGLQVPAAVTLHTVLSDPTPSQRSIMETICGLAARTVVMSQAAAGRLVDCYGFDPDTISVIAHGADRDFAGPSLSAGRPLFMTWGLIGPGKGLEWAIQAFAGLRDLDPLPRYRIVGATHPHVLRDSGEAYRAGLMSLTDRLGLNGMIEFDNRYLDRPDLARLVRSADVVLLPYESAEQVTSGVLVEAIAASKPVVATPFPHAVEVLADGAGAIVPHNDPGTLSATLRTILSEASIRSRMTQKAGQLATDWYWPTIGQNFASMMLHLAYPKMPVTTTTERHFAAG